MSCAHLVHESYLRRTDLDSIRLLGTYSIARHISTHTQDQQHSSPFFREILTDMNRTMKSRIQGNREHSKMRESLAPVNAIPQILRPVNRIVKPRIQGKRRRIKRRTPYCAIGGRESALMRNRREYLRFVPEYDSAEANKCIPVLPLSWKPRRRLSNPFKSPPPAQKKPRIQGAVNRA